MGYTNRGKGHPTTWPLCGEFDQMISPDYVRLMASYARWQNRSLMGAAASLSDSQRRQDRGAFFQSIHGTLSHLLWADRLWLSRFTDAIEAPSAPDIPSSVAAFVTWEELEDARNTLDAATLRWAAEVTVADLAGNLGWYSGAMQANIERPKWALVLQLFNHGTHHRGQVHAMLTAAGASPDDTDVPFMPEAHWNWTTGEPG